MIPLPSLGLTSAVVLGSMYAVTFGLMVFLVEAGYLTQQLGILLVVGLVLLQFLLGPLLMDWSLRLFGSLTWVEHSTLPSHLVNFIAETCRKHRLPLPKIGIISDGAPQAYTYGRTPSSARLVLSAGLLEVLEPDEAEAVVAHELGHIHHWDFVVMTLAQLIPLLLYHLYRTCYDLSRRRSGGKDDKSGPYLIVAAVIAYVAYLIADYLVMFVSRVREYWADKFSVETTGNPNSLIRALTKIAYGLVTAAKVEETQPRTESTEKKLIAVQALGIMSVAGSKEIALYASQGLTERAEDLKDVMKWDLWSPWAAYYELHSTHPLTAKRINAIAAHAINLGMEPAVLFDLQKPESYWDDFARDLLVMALPALGAISLTAVKLVFYSKNLKALGIFEIALPFVLGLSLGGILKTLATYPGEPFLDHSILSLLKKVKVSPVMSYPVRVRGKVVGRGDPGKIFSEDLVIRDRTGMIFLDYEQPLQLFNWLFALFKLKQYEGQEVVVEGWYRRAPTPYIEVKTIRSDHASSTAYTYHWNLFIWLLLPVIVLLFRWYLR